MQNVATVETLSQSGIIAELGKMGFAEDRVRKECAFVAMLTDDTNRKRFSINTCTP